MYALPDDKDGYILVIHSINFNEVWTQGIYEAINKTFTQEHTTVLGEELSIPAIKDTTDVNEKLEILRNKYPTPPKVVVCIGDRPGCCAVPFSIMNGKMYLPSSAIRRNWSR